MTTWSARRPGWRYGVRRTGLLAGLGLAAGVGAAALVVRSGQVSGLEAAVSAVLAMVVGWAYVGCGLIAWREHGDNRLGPIMVFIGFAWFATFLAYSDQSLWFTLGTAVEDIYLVGFVYLVFSFPTGRISDSLDRALVASAVVVSTVVEFAWLLFADSDELICSDCPANALQVTRNDALAEGILQGQRVVGLTLSVFTVVLLVRRVRRASVPQRRAVAPVLWTGGAMFAALALSVANDVAGEPFDGVPEFMRAVVFAAIPVSVLAVLLRRRLARGAVAELVVELGGESPVDLRQSLSRALGDPGLQLAYWIPVSQSYVDADGQPYDLPSDDAQRVTTVVERDGRPVAALVQDRALHADPGLVESVSATAALALDNERLRAELLARLSELQASRARLVHATDAERRRIERDLHDGAQQRLISLAMTLGLAESKLTSDPHAVGPMLGEARAGITRAIEELRRLSQGIRPAILVERGLGAALDDLARRAAVPVRLDLRIDDAIPSQIEAAAYFVASEALTNAAKHARATKIRLTAITSEHLLALEVADDGVGGAALDAGSGLRGLADRIEALGGVFTVSSRPGHGTILRAELPCG